ncbi:DUF1534 domain-containing protein [Pseudomonas syringae pv. actinidiae]|nr:DUF1534 domain-containing protein [Pseudomonas syringae pv. actinidiae]NVL46822.1 DUF1534 domain-containing protein [Pseudomonas syringae pv. actinidiae]NVL59022.1 DUF1534 domain-containing protein [Pseudomonas syringae pv. actinidiae]
MEDAERPERHTHAEHGHDRWRPGHPSFRTLQRGNAVRDAPRHTQIAGMGTAMSCKQINIGKINRIAWILKIISF